MEGEGVFEADVEIARGAGVVGGMESVAEITTDHHHADVDTQSDAGAQCEILEEGVPAQLSTGTQRVVLEKPYVSGIEEEGAVEHAHDREAVFGVELKLERTGLVEVAIALRLGHAV